MKQQTCQKQQTILTRFFIAIAEETINNNRNTRKQQLHQSQLEPLQTSFLTTGRQETSKIVGSLQPKSSVGYDDIPSKLLTFCEGEQIDPLIYITNKNLYSGILLSDLNIAKVYQFDKVSKTEAANYRSISLIPTFSKII